MEQIGSKSLFLHKLLAKRLLYHRFIEILDKMQEDMMADQDAKMAQTKVKGSDLADIKLSFCNNN